MDSECDLDFLFSFSSSSLVAKLILNTEKSEILNSNTYYCKSTSLRLLTELYIRDMLIFQ
jgi:hypothetical protein